MATPSSGAILVATGDFEAQHYLETALSSQGFSVCVVDTAREVCETLGDASDVSLVLLDHGLSPGTQLGLISEIRKIDRHLPIVLMTALFGHSAGELGGYDNVHTLPKPVFYDDLSRAISALTPERPVRTQEIASARPYFELAAAARNPRMRQISRLIDQAARSDVPVIVQGETGVGKEMLVREIHARSRRSQRPFVNINCAALPKELVESQLFGHERGAFTGAHRSQAGLFEVADGGTILLDEIGDMDIRLQAKLLQVLQDNEFHRLGGSETVRVDVRVMCATHRDLEESVLSGRMRADLYYRLKVVCIEIPPIRERKDEILPLAEFFLRKHTAPGQPMPELDTAIKRHLLTHDWPGNVRELENVMRRYLVLRDGSVFRNLHPVSAQPMALDGAQAEPGGGTHGSIFQSLDQAKRNSQTEALLAALNATHWNRKRAAELLGVDYKQFLYQMKKLQIEGSSRRTRLHNGSRRAGHRPELTAADA
jgi:DNA-binding NtrC family response regulator